jgi:methylated-DNA-[protein]-cysteine S-methyltransferase
LVDHGAPVWFGKLGGNFLGEIWVAHSSAGLVSVSLWGDRELFAEQVHKLTGTQPSYAPEQVQRVTQQLAEYLKGERNQFEIKIDWTLMTQFQQDVLRAVCDIEYGRTCTYGDIARELGKPKAMRAVGRANATNPMPIIIPCHRVLGADGRLHGYSAPGGVETKARLLRLEGSWLI